MTTAVSRLAHALAVLGIAVAATACGSSGGSTAATSGGCAYVPAGSAARNVGTPTPGPGAPYNATLHTNVGAIGFRALAGQAPCTANSFKFLAQHGYFDNTKCHRLTTAGIFVLQCGDPTGTGTGGPGYSFPDENLSGATYPAGTVAMANSGPNTNGSQFFLVYQDSELPPSYTPFGKITAGLNVLTSVAAKGTDSASGDGHPNQPVTIANVALN